MFSYTFYKSSDFFTLIRVKYPLISSLNRLFLQAQNHKSYLNYMPTTCQQIRQTNMLCEHRQLRRACANAQSHQGIRCSHTPRIRCCVREHIKAMHVDGGSDNK